TYLMPWKEYVTSESQAGEKRTDKVYDSTPSQSLNILSAGLLGHLTSEAAPWFQYRLVNTQLIDEPDVREWLEDVTRIHVESLGKTNFYQVILEFYEDLCGFGTAHLFQAEDDEEISRFYVFPPREVCIAENERGVVDTHYREYKQTLRNLAREFGAESLSREARDALEKEPDKKITVVHVTTPRENWIPGRIDKEGKPFASIYYEKDTRHLLHEGGYWEDPWHTARWRKTSREVYGRGPGIDAMPDIKTLHKQRRSDLLPNAINYFRRDHGREKPEALGEILGNVPFGMEMTQDTRNLVKQAFFVDVFLMLSQQTTGMTATEVVERVQERLMILGPAIGRLHSEALGPAIERGFNIMSRAGMFPDPPQALEGEALTVDYISPLAKALKALEGRATQNAMQFAVPFLQLDPDAAVVFDAKKAIRRAWDLYGAPTEALRSEEEVAMIEQERAKLAQLQMMLQMAAQGAAVEKTGEEAESARAARG
ncbi:MAG: head-tail connector protein, partial [Deltaproteobacteria bacterium]|nr:head-tail connector protein [Deltaproteobacteria bacterium]